MVVLWPNNPQTRCYLCQFWHPWALTLQYCLSAITEFTFCAWCLGIESVELAKGRGFEHDSICIFCPCKEPSHGKVHVISVILSGWTLMLRIMYFGALVPFV